MQSNAKIAVALVGGYLLGRTKKAKMAIGLGMFLAGKKISLDPRELSRLAAASPLVSGLSDQVRKDLVDGTRTAVTSAVTQRANTLADTLHERTLDLDDPLRGGREDDEGERDAARGDGAADDGAPDDGAPDEGEDGRPRRGARKAAPAKASKTAKASTSTARRSAGKASSKASSGGRTAARKTAGTARRTAAGGRRKAADRGDADG
ncbi:hypothetical protein [Actinomadura sediminis]|uniref:DNA primase n=1 Tax=Actinomadura sediminis TaxID=1038904 RepID=A0ABW3ESH1_9ACTN